MEKLLKFYRYLNDFLRYGQIRPTLAAIIYIFFGRSILRTRLVRGKLGFFLHRKDTLDFQFANYAYEWGVKRFMLNHYADKDVFIDVGANIGTYSVMLGGKGLRVYAFEPAYENFKALNINIMLNKLEKNFKGFNFGLSNENSRAGFNYDPLNTGASHLDILPFEDETFAERAIHTEIEIRRFDDIVKELDIKAFDRILMKIDVEGMEAQVIEGAKEFIRNHENITLVMECVHTGKELLMKKLDEIGKFEYIEVDNLNFGAKKIA
ncbi:MAG TPA: FkbM family methyltransferase [Bacteroidales bacterium]|nr:FkbM family methyltransferase [Bacteroidales bacterium]